MNTYDVQITTNLNEVVILQICAYSDIEAKLTAIFMVEKENAEFLVSFDNGKREVRIKSLLKTAEQK